MNWQPIETAPRDGTVIFAYWTSPHGFQGSSCYGVTCFERGEWIAADDEEIVYSEPTHWMPLPAPPKT